MPDEPKHVKCPCGGDTLPTRMDVTSVMSVCKPPRYHKKRRFREKFKKQWKKDNAAIALGLSLLSCLTPPMFKCDKCGKTEGFYQHLGKNLFSVEPLGAPAGIVHYLDAKYPNNKAGVQNG